MFYVALAAQAINPEDYSWLVFTRSTKMKLSGYNQRHTLTLSKGDVFGIRRTRSNTYQAVKSDALHVLYRNIPEATHDRIMKTSIPYTGTPITPQEVEDGFMRHRRVSTKDVAQVKRSNKMTSDFYVPDTKKIKETFSINQDHYQWRKVVKGPVKVETKKQGKVKAVLRTGDIIGLRYQTAARGGYILLDGNVRVHIAHENYSTLVQASRPLPIQQQKKDVIDLKSGMSDSQIEKLINVKHGRRSKAEIEAQKVEEEEEVIPQLYDLDGMDDEDILSIKRERQSKQKRNLRRMVRKLFELDDQATWEENTDAEFEEDEDSPAASPSDDSADTEAEDTEAKEQEEDDLLDDEDEDLLEDDLEDEGKDEAVPEDDSESSRFDDDDKVTDILEPGMQFKLLKGRGRTFVVVESSPMERNENITEFILHDPASDTSDNDFNLYRLRLNVNMPFSKFKDSAEILEAAMDEDALKELQDSIEYADITSISLVK